MKPTSASHPNDKRESPIQYMDSANIDRDFSSAVLISWHLIGEIRRNHVKMKYEGHTQTIENQLQRSHENVERNFSFLISHSH